MKKFLPYSILAVLVAVIGFFAFVQTGSKVSAWNDNYGWGECVSTGPQCGTDNGTQSKTVYDSPTFTCPEGYQYQNNGDFDQRCHRIGNDHWIPEHVAPTGATCPKGDTKSGSGENTTCSHVVTQECHTGVIQHDSCPVPTATPTPTEGCGDDCDVTPTPTPTATPSATPTPTPTSDNGGGNAPTFAGSSTNAPVCGDGTTVQLPANPFVVRQGDTATVNFFITEGNQANIYYKELGQSDWDHSVIGVKPNSDNFVSYTIGGLNPQVGYDFGVQQVQGCGGGQLVTAVIIDGASYNPVLFKFSYWEWSK